MCDGHAVVVRGRQHGQRRRLRDRNRLRGHEALLPHHRVRRLYSTTVVPQTHGPFGRQTTSFGRCTSRSRTDNTLSHSPIDGSVTASFSTTQLKKTLASSHAHLAPVVNLIQKRQRRRRRHLLPQQPMSLIPNTVLFPPTPAINALPTSLTRIPHRNTSRCSSTLIAPDPHQPYRHVTSGHPRRSSRNVRHQRRNISLPTTHTINCIASCVTLIQGADIALPSTSTSRQRSRLRLESLLSEIQLYLLVAVWIESAEDSQRSEDLSPQAPTATTTEDGESAVHEGRVPHVRGHHVPGGTNDAPQSPQTHLYQGLDRGHQGRFGRREGQ